MLESLYLGLVHYPINNKHGDVVTTSVTNMDIHDISRSCRTFGVKKYFLVTPLEIQHQVVERILNHWEKEESSAYNPDRSVALKVAELVFSIDDAIQSIKNVEGKEPLIVVTGANFKEFSGSAADLVHQNNIDRRPILLLFGTGWGLHASVIDRAGFKLSPIRGSSKDGYNHLSVRSAVAIYLSRLQEASESNY